MELSFKNWYYDLTAPQARMAIVELFEASAWYAVTPLPDDRYRLTVKQEPALRDIIEARIADTPQEHYPVQPSCPRTAIYSVFLAWNADDMDQGCYGTVVEARSCEEALSIARRRMYESDCADDPADILPEDIPEYDILEIVQGADIWAAPRLLTALRTAVGAAERAGTADGDPEWYLEALAAIRAGEGATD